MKYNTNDLSKILNVSTNTIRRYEEKGFLHAVRNENNGYREFDNTDVERLMYINKYRRIGFSQEDITAIFAENMNSRKQRFENKMQAIDNEIARLTSLKHMLKDDMQLLYRINDYGDSIKVGNSASMYYLLYQIKGNVDLGKKQTEAVHDMLQKTQEYEYMYLFERDDYMNQRMLYSEGIVVNKVLSQKYGICTEEPVLFHESTKCLMRVIRVPLNLNDNTLMEEAEIKTVLFKQFLEHINENEYVLSGDVIGIKLGLSKEDGNDWQYILMHVPVQKKEG